jgi:F0F1-type ATP synthase assembly protein I
MKNPDSARAWTIVLARYLGLAFLLPAAALVGYGLGYWADSQLGTGQGRTIGLIIGVAAGITQLVRELLREKV